MAQANDSSSISFLDLLTCGLGGILLLFFIVVALRDEIDLDGQQTEKGKAVEKDSVVLIHIASPEGETLFDKSGAWVLVQDSEVTPMPQSITTSFGSSFAVFYAVKPLPRGSKLRLDGIRSDAKFEVVVTDRFGSQDVDSKLVQSDGWVYSW
ncbi:MAG: hypothetical protein U0892_04385 [Pirellulales bacterium]